MSVPVPGTADHQLQRAVLRELLFIRRRPGWDIARLAAGLGEPPEAIAQAVIALVAAGLVETDGEVVQPTASACYFDALLPATV